jgi:hypothetical protein
MITVKGKAPEPTWGIGVTTVIIIIINYYCWVCDPFPHQALWLIVIIIIIIINHWPRTIGGVIDRRGCDYQSGDKSNKRGLNLNGSWQQGHSTTHNTQFELSRLQRIFPVIDRNCHPRRLPRCCEPRQGNRRIRSCIGKTQCIRRRVPTTD